VLVNVGVEVTAGVPLGGVSPGAGVSLGSGESVTVGVPASGREISGTFVSHSSNCPASMGCGWLGLVVLGVVSTYAARLILFAAIRHIGTAQLALLTPLETLLTVIWSLLFLGERLTLPQWLGGGLILVSGLLAVRRLSRVRPPAAKATL